MEKNFHENGVNSCLKGISGILWYFAVKLVVTTGISIEREIQRTESTCNAIFWCFNAKCADGSNIHVFKESSNSNSWYMTINIKYKVVSCGDNSDCNPWIRCISRGAEAKDDVIMKIQWTLNAKKLNYGVW